MPESLVESWGMILIYLFFLFIIFISPNQRNTIQTLLFKLFDKLIQ